MFPVLIALILACPIAWVIGFVMGLRRADRPLTPEQAAALWTGAQANMTVSPQEAVRNGETG